MFIVWQAMNLREVKTFINEIRTTKNDKNILSDGWLESPVKLLHLFLDY